jgi:hypothetical protein
MINGTLGKLKMSAHQNAPLRKWIFSTPPLLLTERKCSEHMNLTEDLCLEHKGDPTNYLI